MTLVQASIAEEGNAVILIADRLLTTKLSADLPSYEYEAGVPKIFYRGNVGIGFAGASIHADACIAKLDIETDFDKIVNIVSCYISGERTSRIDKEIKRLTGLPSNDFFTKQDLPIPQEVRDGIYYKMKQYQVNCQSVLTGYDKGNKARIVVIDEDGDPIEATNFNTFSSMKNF